MATWNVWLLNKDGSHMCVARNVIDFDMPAWLMYAFAKVSDGSDADAMQVCRSDQMPNDTWV